jgi:hypothetical protein
MSRLLPRPTPLIVLVLAAMVLAACSSDSESTKTRPKRTAAPTSSTSPAPGGSTPLTLNADPAECLRGTFRFTRMDYDGPVQTQFGPTTIKGAIAGRRIGSSINIPLPPDGTGVKETFGLNGEANYTCERDTVTVRFPALTIGLARV